MDRIIKMSCALGCCALLFGSIAFITSGQESAQTTIEAAVTTTQASANAESATVSESETVEAEQVQNAQADEQTTLAQAAVTTTQEAEEVQEETVEVQTVTQAAEETTQAIVQVSQTADEVAEEVSEEETAIEDTVEEEQDIDDSIITIDDDESEIELDEQTIQDVVETVFDEVEATVTGGFSENLVLDETSSTTPSKVTSLKFSQSHNDEVTIYWPSASNATGYEVYVSADGGETFTLHKKTSDTSYVCSDLNSTTDYQFKIVAYNGTVYGEYSNVFSYTIETTNGIYNIDATNITDTTATITWDAVEGATYKIEQKGTYTWNTVATGVTTSSYDLTGLTAGSDATIRVSAKLDGSSSYGTAVEFSFKTVVGTVVLSVDSAESDEIEFSWSAVTGATEYEVYVAIDGGAFALVETKTSTNYTLDRDENCTYEIKVRAIDASGDEKIYGAFSESISIAGLLKEVTNLQEVITTGYTTKISWDAVDGAAEYQIYKYNSYGNYWYAYGTTTATSFSETLTADGSRVYKVAAIDENGVPGVISDAVMATTANLSITFSTTKTTISWPAVSGAKLYIVSMKSLNGLTYTEQVTSTTNSATLYLPADSTVSLIIKAYSDTSGDTFLSNAVSEFQVVTPELYLYTSSDSSTNILSSLRSELVYFTQVINNTKYYDGDVTLTSEATFSMSASDFKLDGENVDDIFDGMLEDFGDDETETSTYTFSNGSAKDDSGRTIDLDESFVPFENDAYLYNAQDDSVKLYNYIEMVDLVEAGEHYITENADGTYSISVTIKLEQNTDLYHAGFTTVFGNDDLGDDSFAITDAQYGATTINATFTDEGYLLSLEVVSPFVFSATASLAGEDSSLGNLSMKISGSTTYKYTFTYN